MVLMITSFSGIELFIMFNKQVMSSRVRFPEMVWRFFTIEKTHYADNIMSVLHFSSSAQELSIYKKENAYG